MIEIYWIRTSGPGRLAVMPRPRGGDWLEDELRSLRNGGVDILVSMLTREEETDLEIEEEGPVAQRLGLEFVSHPILDRNIPGNPDATWALARRLADQFKTGRKIAVHCRMGIGRSPLLLACLLVTLGIPPEDAWTAIGAARGCRVPDTEEQRQWLLDTTPES